MPLEEGGSEGTIENEQPLCQSCSDEKTAIESARGVARWQGQGKPFVAKAAARVTIVSGPPGSGKTTYVEQRRRPGDLVWDLDAIAQVIAQCPRFPRPAHVTTTLHSLRETFMRSVMAAPVSAYIIVADHEHAEQLAREYGADVVHLQSRKSP